MIWHIAAALLLSLGLVLAVGPALIRKLKKLHFGQTIYELGPAHQKKQGTPVMGGLMMALGITAACLICHPLPWTGLQDPMIGLLAVALLSMCVGLADDWIKAVKKRHDGLSPWQKIAGQVIIAGLFSTYCYVHPSVGSSIRIPFITAEWNLGIFYIPVMMLTVIFYVNSANLQDGLDGLLGTVSAVSSGAWLMIALFGTALLGWAGDACSSAAILSAAAAGACVGYLRFNRYPARVFMGDTGSMLLGGVGVGTALILRQPLLLLLLGFCPVMSSLSVIIQRYYFKATHGKRIFLMSPIHHHFEKKGYSETQIVSMYAGVTLVLSLIGILSLLVGRI